MMNFMLILFRKIRRHHQYWTCAWATRQTDHQVLRRGAFDDIWNDLRVAL